MSSYGQVQDPCLGRLELRDETRGKGWGDPSGPFLFCVDEGQFCLMRRERGKWDLETG